jgi:hypothetical protein
MVCPQVVDRYNLKVAASMLKKLMQTADKDYSLPVCTSISAAPSASALGM